MSSPTWNTKQIRVDMTLRGWTQRELSKQAGVGENTVSRLVRGLPTTAPQVRKVARALGQRLDRYLVAPAGVDPAEPPARRATASAA